MSNTGKVAVVWSAGGQSLDFDTADLLDQSARITDPEATRRLESRWNNNSNTNSNNTSPRAD